jgi:hypothetical protein
MIRKFRFITVVMACLLTSFMAQSVTLEDVIYKKDGSVLRGTLIEQDFANGKYKIQLQGGSVFSVDKGNIEKISKEAPLVDNSPNTSANANNSANINQSLQVEQNPAQNESYVVPSETRGTFYIGSMIHTLKTTTVFSESVFTYTGLNLAGQFNMNQHFAIYADLNIGSFSEKEETDRFGNTNIYSGSDLTDEDYSSAQVAAILSTNLYQGWQLFTGLGVYSESYTTANDSFDTSGTDFQLGLGYSWQTVQLLLRINILNSSDYSDAVDSSTTGHLQFGFNF